MAKRKSTKKFKTGEGSVSEARKEFLRRLAQLPMSTRRLMAGRCAAQVVPLYLTAFQTGALNAAATLQGFNVSFRSAMFGTLIPALRRVRLSGAAMSAVNAAAERAATAARRASESAIVAAPNRPKSADYPIAARAALAGALAGTVRGSVEVRLAAVTAFDAAVSDSASNTVTPAEFLKEISVFQGSSAEDVVHLAVRPLGSKLEKVLGNLIDPVSNAAGSTSEAEILFTRYMNYVSGGINLNELQDWLLEQRLVDFDVQPPRKILQKKNRRKPVEDPASPLPDEFANINRLALMMFHAALLQRDDLHVLSEPTPQAIDELFAQLWEQALADGVQNSTNHKLHPIELIEKDLWQRIREHPQQSGSFQSRPFQPPKLWLAWLNNVHRQTMTDAFARIARRLQDHATQREASS